QAPTPPQASAPTIHPAPKIEPAPEPTTTDVLNPNQARKAIEQFAKNFAGEIITSEESGHASPDPSPITSAEELKTRPVSNRPPLEVDNIEDLPF
ncbi:MAG: hypothetical protein ACO36E_09350, partial [Synechocystis sp.]